MKVKTKKKKMTRIEWKENVQMFIMLIPGLVLTFIFSYMPMPGIVLAFKNFNPNKGIWGSDWVGLKNFEFFFTSTDAVRTIRNTLMYSVSWLIIDLVAAVGLALMLYFLRSGKAVKFYNTVVIIPKFMSTVIIAFIAYTILSPSYGLLNQVIRLLGGQDIQWYMEAGYWPVIMTIVHVWQTVGMNSILYYASLMSMDESQIEAAKIDGANLRQQIWYVIVPHLIPIMVVTTILAIRNLFSGDFGLFYQVTQEQGLLYPTTDIINTYTYRALLSGSYEKSTAVGLFQSLMGLILILISNGIVRKVSPENAMF